MTTRHGSMLGILGTLWVVGACATADGRDPYALFQTYTHEGGQYSFRYLAPPWQIVEGVSSDDVQVAAIEPLSGIDADTDGAPDARIKMVVALGATDSDAEAAAISARALWLERAEEVREIRRFENRDGDVGYETVAVFVGHYVRAVFYDTADGRVVRVTLVSREPLERPDMRLLLAGVTLIGEDV